MGKPNGTTTLPNSEGAEGEEGREVHLLPAASEAPATGIRPLPPVPLQSPWGASRHAGVYRAFGPFPGSSGGPWGFADGCAVAQEHEVDGKDFFFTNLATLRASVEADEFLESSYVLGTRVRLPRSAVAA